MLRLQLQVRTQVRHPGSHLQQEPLGAGSSGHRARPIRSRVAGFRALAGRRVAPGHQRVPVAFRTRTRGCNVAVDAADDHPSQQRARVDGAIVKTELQNVNASVKKHKTKT